jgi:GxxExxY protein
MKRSRFFPAVCSCTKTADQLFQACLGIASTAAQKLGRGHSEKTFENFMIDKLYEARIPALRQQTYFSHIDGKTYPVGIVDIEVDQSVILELKANHNTITEDFKTQARRYLRSAREKYPQNELIAAVLLFTKSGDVVYWRVKSRPVRSCVDVPEVSPGESAGDS